MPWSGMFWRSGGKEQEANEQASLLPTALSSSPAETASTAPTSLANTYTHSLSSLLGLPPTHPAITILIPTLTLTSISLLGIRTYKATLRQYPTSAHIPPHVFRGKSIYGYVSSVGDGDNFRFFHTPGGRLAGWGFLPGRRAHLPPRPSAGLSLGNTSALNPSKGKPSGSSSGGGGTQKLETLHVRLAGVDAPELAHFGRPEQPYGAEALTFLRSLILHRYVRATLYRRDQYERVVGSAYVSTPPPYLLAPVIGALQRQGLVVRTLLSPVEVILRALGWTWNFIRGKRKTDISLAMLEEGMATVYEAKFGSEFGGKETEKKYRKAEAVAKAAKKGLWAGGQGSLGGEKGDAAKSNGGGFWSRIFGSKKDAGTIESPREYKNRMKDLEAGKAKK